MSDLLKSYRFREERETDWRKLDLIVRRAERGGVAALSDDDILALPRLYRQAVSSLSVARSISLDQNVLAYLESLCARAYFFVYGSRSTLGEKLSAYFGRDWPAAARSAVWPTLLSALCLFGGGALAFALCLVDMDWFWTFNSPGLFDGRTPNATTEYLRSTLYDGADAPEDTLAAFAAQLFSHNSRIALFAFALGFAFGAPTALLLIYNGLTLGAFYALFWSRGLGAELTGWLFIHGVTELFAVVLAGAAGFMIGGAIAFPGERTRLAAARETGARASSLAIGTVAMLFLAALLEGFGRQLINADWLRYAIALSTLAFWLLYFYAPRRSNA